MNIFSALFLAVVQGITEWLPVSSSGHLVVSEFFIGEKVDLVFDVALHFGTLMAIFVYFGRDVVDIVRNVLSLNFKSQAGRMGLLLIIATIPGALIGYFFEKIFTGAFGSLIVVGLGFCVTSMFLFLASLDLGIVRKELKIFDAFLIGLVQAFAILPGVSRSGTTLSCGIFLGLTPRAAARFSFLLAIPIIFGATLYEIGNQTLPSSLIWATILAFIIGLIVVHFMFKVVLTEKRHLRWFAGYALLLGLSLVVYSIFK